MIFVKNSIPPKPRNDLDKDCELLWIEVGKPKVLVESSLMLVPCTIPVLLCGDFMLRISTGRT